jgi:hypothetical protein
MKARKLYLPDFACIAAIAASSFVNCARKAAITRSNSHAAGKVASIGRSASQTRNEKKRSEEERKKGFFHGVHSARVGWTALLPCSGTSKS